MTHDPASDHRSTDQEMAALKAARERLGKAGAAVPEDGSPVPHTALVELLEASRAFHLTVRAVLYGPLYEGEHGPETVQHGPRGRLYDLSNEAAQAAWPTTSPPPAPPAPGGDSPRAG